MGETITTKSDDLTSEIFLSAGEFLIVNFELIYNHVVNSASSNVLPYAYASHCFYGNDFC